MTLENSKRLYEHYLKIGNKKNADELIKKHPEIFEKPSEIENKKFPKKEKK